MPAAARVRRCALRRAGVTLLLALAALLLTRAEVSAQRPAIDPRSLSLVPADLPRDFAVLADQTAFEPLRGAPDDSGVDAVGVIFRTAMERPRTQEHLQSGPFRVSQVIARTDDPRRAAFSLDAQRDLNVREHGFEQRACTSDAVEILCLARHDGPFDEYRVFALKGSDTMVSTTWSGLSSAVNLDGLVALTQVSLTRYDQHASTLLAAERPRVPDVEAAARQSPPSPTPAPTPPPTATPQPSPTQRAAPAAQPTATSTPKAPANIDDRLMQPWSELMELSATMKSGEKMSAFLHRVVDSTGVKLTVGRLGPNIGGQLRRVARINGDTATVLEGEIIVNQDIMNESPRVIASILAHEITHANQPVTRSGGRLADCVEVEVEAYAVQAEVWAAFWGQDHRPGQTKWERSMNIVEETWKNGREQGLRSLIRDETATDADSCIH